MSRLARWITVAVIVSIALAAGSAAALTPQQAAMVSSLKQPLGPVGLAAARAHQRHFVAGAVADIATRADEAAGARARAAVARMTSAQADAGRVVARAAEAPQVLGYQGGPVVHNNRTHLIFWQPANSGLAFDPGYIQLVDAFMTEVAGDSHLQFNINAISGQYGDSNGQAAYDSTYGGATVDTDALPPNGCTNPSPPPLDTGPAFPNGAAWTVCLNDAQLQTEIEHIVSVDNLPQTQADIYFMVTPDGFGSCVNAGPDQCADGGGGPLGTYGSYCGYHSVTQAFGLLYSMIPYNAVNVTVGGTPDIHCQADNPRPNGNPADPAISTIAHELNETTTDPTGNGWINPTSMNPELADMCEQNYGPLLGGVAPPGGGGDGWNQDIGTGHYFLQSLWSNADGNVTATACVAHAAFDTVAMTVPTRVQGDRNVSFKGTGSQPHGSIVRYLWSFGDGNSGSHSKTTHTYTKVGNVRVLLGAVDSWDNIAFAAQQVTVIKPPRPVAKVTAGPAQNGSPSRPRFRFTSTAVVAKYECRVDSGRWRTCKSPWTAPKQASGRHRMFVRATDTFKQVSHSPASYGFRVA